LAALDLDPKDNNLIKVRLVFVEVDQSLNRLTIMCFRSCLHRLPWIDLMRTMWKKKYLCFDRIGAKCLRLTKFFLTEAGLVLKTLGKGSHVDGSLKY